VTPGLRQVVGEAWAFRAYVEQDAALRFARLAEAISVFDRDSPTVPLMLRAAEDERRHTGLCTELATAYGRAPDLALSAPTDIAPPQLGARQSVLYEVVAACCITETESMATLTTLLAGHSEPRVRDVLHEIARDEVNHSRMGWAHLAREARQLDVSFLAAYIPSMLSGTVDDGLFGEARPGENSEELLRYGVLPHAQKRETFTRTLREVVLPGLENFGIDPAPASAWLATRSGVG
jgi:hypothetical protein